MSIQTTQVDCRGMKCPAPILQVSRAAKAHPRPGLLVVQADDADFETDIRAWCRSTGAVLNAITQDGGVATAEIHLPGAPGAAADEAQPQDKAPVRAVAAAVEVQVDCVGLRCPAPILAVSKAAKTATGPTLLIVTADDGDFPTDIAAWCRSTKNELFSSEQEGEVYTATIGLHGATLSAAVPGLDLRGVDAGTALLKIGQEALSNDEIQFSADPGPIEAALSAWAMAMGRRVETEVLSGVLQGRVLAPGSAPAPVAPSQGTPAAQPQPQLPAVSGVPRRNQATILLLHSDFEPMMAALMVANACAAQGMDVVVFFSFWGVNILRADHPRKPEKPPGLLKKMMKWMMPAGPERQGMSKMNMGGMGVGMMKHFMRKDSIMGPRDLINQAVEQDVRFLVCTMSMGLMGIAQEDLMPLSNIEYGGVTAFTSESRESAIHFVF